LAGWLDRSAIGRGRDDRDDKDYDSYNGDADEFTVGDAVCGWLLGLSVGSGGSLDWLFGWLGGYSVTPAQVALLHMHELSSRAA